LIRGVPHRAASPTAAGGVPAGYSKAAALLNFIVCLLITSFRSEQTAA